MNAYKKVISSILILVFAMTLLSGCATEVVYNEFPLEKSFIENYLVERNLDWKITEEKSFGEGHVVYRFENNNDKLISFISSFEHIGMRSLNLSFFPKDPNVHKSISEPVNEEQWNNLLNLACDLYGNSPSHEKIYKKLIDYVDSRDSKIYANTSFELRLKDEHIRIDLRASNDVKGRYDLAGIFIRNTKSFEQTILDLGQYKKRTWTRLGVDIIEDKGIEEIKKLCSEGNETKGLIIQGHLEKIKNASKEDLPTKSDELTKIKTNLFEGDFLTATLVNESGSIKVLMPSYSLTKKELSVVRNHYITYLPLDDRYTLHYSALEDEVEKDESK